MLRKLKTSNFSLIHQITEVTKQTATMKTEETCQYRESGAEDYGWSQYL